MLYSPHYSRISVRNINDAERLSRLLPTYFRHPESASSLHELNYETPPDFDRRTSAQPTIQANGTNSDQQIVAQHIGLANFGPHFTKEKYESCLRSGDHPFTNATIITLLTLAPNLTTIRIEELDSDSHVYNFLRSNNYNEFTTRYLQNLQHIELKPNSCSVYADERFYSRFFLFRQLALFHHLPKLESLTVEMITEDINDDKIIPPHLSSISHISVTHSNLGSRTLGGLIRIPKWNSLKTFRYTYGGLSEDGPGDPMLILDVVGKALRTHKSSLEVLELDFGDRIGHNHLRTQSNRDEDDEYFADVLAQLREDPYFVKDEMQSSNTVWPWDVKEESESKIDSHVIGSLVEFDRLRSLKISISALLQPRETRVPRSRLVDVLPRNLEELTLIDYVFSEYPDLDEEVEDFMRAKGEKFPLLEKLEGIQEPVLGEYTKFTHNDDENDVLWKGIDWETEWLEEKADGASYAEE